MATIIEQPELEYFRLNVRRLCADRKQRAVALRADISPEYLSCVLAGRSNPSLGVAANIARGLGVPLTALLTDPALFKI